MSRAPKRVFLSHTSELRTYPASTESFVGAAEAAISAAGHAIVDMKYFTARHDKPATYCVAQVGSCEIFVGLIGFRYGSPVRDQRNLSYTELEYQAATELQIPRLMFLLSEHAVGLPREAFVDDQYGPRQTQFRSRLREADLVLASFNTPDRLRALLYQALRELDTSSDTDRAVVRRLVVALEDRRALYYDYELENADWVRESVQIMRAEFTRTMQDLSSEAPAIVPVQVMRIACRQFLNSVDPQNQQARELVAALASLRSVVGSALLELSKQYTLTIPNGLARIVPRHRPSRLIGFYVKLAAGEGRVAATVTSPDISCVISGRGMQASVPLEGATITFNDTDDVELKLENRGDTSASDVEVRLYMAQRASDRFVTLGHITAYSFVDRPSRAKPIWSPIAADLPGFAAAYECSRRFSVAPKKCIGFYLGDPEFVAGSSVAALLTLAYEGTLRRAISFAIAGSGDNPRRRAHVRSEALARKLEADFARWSSLPPIGEGWSRKEDPS